ncbi:TOMM system kinase/cyclase fusion protein [Thalassomonas sp. RHCl1]|uniref:TOMM system kinase/cyclase fusion protein n=1 Tax=Thalassomonas sp. RHCl1 TaxID=2995320 RepID=UPI00248AD570|nr:TOMM system kinase/cyclase fusion protein [Thalassomonas sp. RHCl1]
MESKTQMEQSIEAVFDSEKYQLIAKIGEGGFGTVYKAKQLSTQQFVAIKFLSLASTFDEDKKRRYIERFHRESDLVRRLNHPNIVCLIDKGQQDDSLLYAVYEYIDGFSLKEHLDSHGPMDAPQAAELMACVLDALSHAHDQGVIHRDIKPANIMLYKVGAKTQVKVLDFGIGTLKNEARQLDYKTITLTQETLGTPSYSAPEQLRGEPPVAQTDIYVWGLVFLECLTGTPTITGSSLASIFHQQLSPANVPLGILAGHSSANFFRRVLNKKAQERPNNTAELYHGFRQLNFNNLVGDLSQTTEIVHHNIPANTITASDFNETLVHEKGRFSYSRLTERKQISVLSIILTTQALTTELLPDLRNDQDVIDTFHSDQMQQCIDIAVRYGAYHVGSLGDTLLFYFGYPHVSDNDNRLCSRAALDIASNVNKKNSLLKNTQGITCHIQMGMQIGLMLSLANNLPEGKATHDAMALCRQAKHGQILCSENVKHLLEGYLHFEGVTQDKQYLDTGSANAQVLYQLRGERQSEAFGFLRGTRKNSAFIGREQELTTLVNLLTLNDSHRLEVNQYLGLKEAVPGKAVKLAHVHGEAGIGKSRLVFELRSQAPAMQHFVAQCLPEHQNNALYPILNCLKFKYSLDALSDENSVTRLQQAIALTSLTEEQQRHGLQVLTAWLNLPLEDNNVLGHLSPDIQKQHLFAVLSQLFCQTSQVSIVKNQSKQHLFIFEDLHWADPTSKEFIKYIVQADEFTQGQHAWINTSREILPDALTGLAFTIIPIVKLSSSSTGEFIGYLFEQQTLAKRLSELLIERTDGIPLFIEELASSLQKQKLVHKVNGIIDFIDSEKQSQVPATIRDSLQQKLDGLKFAKDTAQLAATIGRVFHYDLLVAASNKDEAQVQSDLDELIKTELIYQQRQVDGDSYTFKHALVRDAAYESMTAEIFRHNHLQVADHMRNSNKWAQPSNAALIANHLGLANQFLQAAETAIMAINNSITLSSYTEAKDLYNKSLKWLANASNNIKPTKHITRIKLELTVLTFPAFVSLDGMNSDVLEQIRKEIEHLILTLDEDCQLSRDAQFLSQWETFLRLPHQSKIDEALKLGLTLLDASIKGNKKQQQILLLTQLVHVYICAGDLSQAIESGTRALQLYKEGDYTSLHHQYGWDPKCISLVLMSKALALQGNLTQAENAIAQAEAHANNINSEMNKKITTLFYSWFYYFTDNKEKLSHKTIDLDLSKYTGNEEYYLSFTLMAKEWLLNKTAISESFSTMLLERDHKGPFCYWLQIWLDTELNHNRNKNVIDFINKYDLVDGTKKSGLTGPQPILYRLLAKAYAGIGELKQAENYFLTALNLAEQQGAHMLSLHIAVDYSELLTKSNRTQEANALLTTHYENLVKEEYQYINHQSKFHTTHYNLKEYS